MMYLVLWTISLSTTPIYKENIYYFIITVMSHDCWEQTLQCIVTDDLGFHSSNKYVVSIAAMLSIYIVTEVCCIMWSINLTDQRQ